MQTDIENYSEITKQNRLKKNKVRKKNSFEYEWYENLSETLAEGEYMVNDEYYERKKEIIKQIENSSSIERYISMLFFNTTYNYYGSVITDEIEYYETFFKCFFTGIVAAVFYLFNTRAKDNNTKVFYEKNNVIN